MRVKEWKGTVVFLHEVVAGAAGRSWGVHVAELAGVPAPVVRRAGQLLALLERNCWPPWGAARWAVGRTNSVGSALPLFAAAPPPEPAPDPLRAALEALDPDTLTPREALERLYELKRLLTVPGANPALESH